MNPQVPFYITQILFVITAILIYSIFYTLNYGLKKTDYTPSQRRNIIFAAVFLLTGWFAITSALAFSGLFLDFQSTPPKILILVIPSVLAIIYIANSKAAAKLVAVIPKSWFIYIQSFRILMEIMLLLLFLKNIIPVQMTFDGRNFDILVGLSAPLIAYFFVKKSFSRIIVLLWNIAGLLLVTNIFIIAILSTPGPLRKFFEELPNTIVAYFPFVWIPAFIVPFAYLIHILSIKQIIRVKDED